MPTILYFARVIWMAFVEKGASDEDPVILQCRWNPAVPGEKVTLFPIPKEVYGPMSASLHVIGMV